MTTAAMISTIESGFHGIALTLPRLLTIFLVLPMFSGTAVTGLVRNGFVLVIAIFVWPLIQTENLEMPWPMLVLVAGKEGLVGLLLGLGFGVFFWTIQSVGDLIDFQTGSGSSSFFDPTAGHANGPTGEFLGWFAIALFISAGGFMAMLSSIFDSYRLWPIASFFPDSSQVLKQFVILQGDTLFAWIVKLASPILLVLLLVELGLGLIGRVAPSLNVYSSSQPIKSLLAILIMLLFLSFIYESTKHFLNPSNGLIQYLKTTL